MDYQQWHRLFKDKGFDVRNLFFYEVLNDRKIDKLARNGFADYIWNEAIQRAKVKAWKNQTDYHRQSETEYLQIILTRQFDSYLLTPCPMRQEKAPRLRGFFIWINLERLLLLSRMEQRRSGLGNEQMLYYPF